MASTTMKRFNANKVRALGNLQARSDLQKARDNAHRGVKQRWAVDGNTTPSKPKVRDYLAPKKPDYQPPRLRGASGTRLSASKRAMVLQRKSDRVAFFAELGVEV